ncbi:MAG: hypothetical protein FWC45_07910 [Treponema sp.]|nr:hypothetical protein [Treponema sp.]
MNRNYVIGLAVTVAVLGLLAFAAWSIFEIYPTTEETPPSHEAKANEYLALDRWLEGNGIKVRTVSSGDLSVVSQAKEKQIFIQASLFNWTDEAAKYLVSWVEEGGHLFLALDRNYSDEWEDEEPLFTLLLEFRITTGKEEGKPGYRYDQAAPRFDRRISFAVDREVPALEIKDFSNVTRLVQVNRGKGTVTVTGRPRFLLSESIGDAPNARLAWGIFAADPGDGCFFIRGTARVRGLLGSLFQRGNLAVLAVSVLVLLAVGFWTVIPVFGLVRQDEERPGKLLGERFLAEGRFLKRYGALELYRRAYVKEIKRRLRRKEGLSEDDEIQKRITGIMGMSVKNPDLVLRALSPGGEPVRIREFPKMVELFMNILGRLQ